MMENYSSLGTLINRPVRYVWADFAQIQLMEKERKKEKKLSPTGLQPFWGVFFGGLMLS